MNFTGKVKFLNQCEANIDKIGLYLDLSKKEISCGPCLILKRYYKWMLKYVYNLEIEDKECESYFLSVIEKLDYKVISNMVYDDFKDLLLAYFSLGEIYYIEGNHEKSKEYFKKVIYMMEEILKEGKKYQTDEIQDKTGIVFFEIYMWARKNIGDMKEASEALEIYESIIGEEECLYIEKHYSIFKKAIELNMPTTANDAAKSVMKLLSTYKGINIEVADYLIQAKEYDNALDIVTSEYIKNDINHWINVVNTISREAKTLSNECVNKILVFVNFLIEDLKIVEWSTVMYTLYMNVRVNKVNQLKVLDYLRSVFSKVKSNDFIACGQAILVLQNIYEDIRVRKYKEEYLREYEFDFTLYLMNTAVQNGHYAQGIESAFKLKGIIELTNINKEVISHIEQCLEICLEKLKREEYNLTTYPWSYLYDNLKLLIKEYDIESQIEDLDTIRNISNKIIIGINSLEDEKIMDIINNIVGERIFHRNKDIVLIGDDDIDIKNYIKGKYSNEVIIKNGLVNSNCCIMTYENSKFARLTDVNVIVIDGHRDLRDMDITYMKHILKESIKNKVLILFNSKEADFSEGTIKYNETLINTMLNFHNIEFLDVGEVYSKKEILNVITGEIPQSILHYKFEIFDKDIMDTLQFIKEDIKAVKSQFKEKRYNISECGKEYSYIEEELNNNYKEFSTKVKKDIDFLRDYACDKISAAIPDLLQTRFVAIDDLEDVVSLKEKSEEILSKAVENWCSKNIYKLMLEQFQVYIAKYVKYYGFHKETIERINANRKELTISYPEFAENMFDIEVKELDEIIQEFLINYESYLKSINYKVSIIPNDNILNVVKEGIKVMFLKNEEKAENLRAKIKTSVLENNQSISNSIINNIDEKLGDLHEKLQEIIDNIFKGAKEAVAKEKELVESSIVAIDEKFMEIEKKNSEVEVKMNFLEIELFKFRKEVENKLVYNDSKCYSLT